MPTKICKCGHWKSDHTDKGKCSAGHFSGYSRRESIERYGACRCENYEEDLFAGINMSLARDDLFEGKEVKL